jgi:hypothetical protein
VFDSVCEVLMDKHKTSSKLSLQNEILLFMCKLRLDPPMMDLAYRFGVSVSSVSRIFHKWLNVCFHEFGGLVKWPDTDFVQLPDVFQNSAFCKTKVIIDCFEIAMDRPTALLARCETYSNYKRRNTVKVLIGVSPSGAVIFLSKCWGGRVSDRKITVESGLLDKLNPQDIVLADRGFTVKEDVEMVGAKLKIPAFTRGKKQLSAREVEESRLLARVRIHVERVIGRCRDYKILKGPLPIRLVKKKKDVEFATVDKIVHVCAAFTNLSPPIVN